MEGAGRASLSSGPGAVTGGELPPSSASTGFVDVSPAGLVASAQGCHDVAALAAGARAAATGSTAAVTAAAGLLGAGFTAAWLSAMEAQSTRTNHLARCLDASGTAFHHAAAAFDASDRGAASTLEVSA